MISVKGLVKAFGDHVVLNGIDEHIKKGERLLSSAHQAQVNPPSFAA